MFLLMPSLAWAPVFPLRHRPSADNGASRYSLASRCSLSPNVNEKPFEGAEADSLSLWWPEGSPALREISLRVEPGTLAMIAGSNGSGKSTLLSVLRGILLPDLGAVRVASPCAYIWQDPQRQILFPLAGMNVAASVAEAREDHPFFPKCTEDFVRTKVLRCLEQVGFYPPELVFSKPARQLSGGEKQRVAIAAALAMEPRTMLFDEITASVDPGNKSLLMDIVPRLVKKNSIAALWVTHARDELELADHIFFMEKGQLISSGPPKDVLPVIDLESAKRSIFPD